MLKLGFWEMEMFGPVDWSFMKTEDTFKKRRCSFFGDSFWKNMEGQEYGRAGIWEGRNGGRCKVMLYGGKEKGK